ncbi:MAG: hypothetical protein OXF44_12005 [Anaerolineaceae bacterium]|nr:hypothetical protein [Anaerolineaceae bacterium]
MDLLCLALVFVGAGMALVVAVMLGVTQRAGHRAITRNFQDAEYILAQHSAPPSWSEMSLWQRVLRFRTREKPTPGVARNLRRLAALVAFFEHSTFFEDERARESLLGQLREELERWERDVGPD